MEREDELTTLLKRVVEVAPKEMGAWLDAGVLWFSSLKSAACPGVSPGKGDLWNAPGVFAMLDAMEGAGFTDNALYGCSPYEFGTSHKGYERLPDMRWQFYVEGETRAEAVCKAFVAVFSATNQAVTNQENP